MPKPRRVALLFIAIAAAVFGTLLAALLESFFTGRMDGTWCAAVAAVTASAIACVTQPPPERYPFRPAIDRPRSRRH